MNCFSDILNLSVDDMKIPANVNTISFADMVATLVSKYTSEYCGAADAANNVDVVFEYSMENMVAELLEEQILDLIATKLPALDSKKTVADLKSLVSAEFKDKDTTAAYALIESFVKTLESAYTDSPKAIDKAAILADFVDALALSAEEADKFEKTAFAKKVSSLIAPYDNILLNCDESAIFGRISKIFGKTAAELRASEYGIRIKGIMDKYASAFDGAYDDKGNLAKTTVTLSYSYVYATDIYITDSFALDSDYVYTDYTIDNGNVTMVTYKKGDSVVRFILNYNNYRVTVKLSATEVYTLEKYGCQPIYD